MRTWNITLLAVAAAGCNPVSVTPAVGPDGAPGWYTIECSKSRIACYERAGQVCPRGYIGEAEKVDSTVFLDPSKSPGAKSNEILTIAPVTSGKMLIRCR